MIHLPDSTNLTPSTGMAGTAVMVKNSCDFLPFLPQGFSGIIDRARHLHNFPKTI